MNRTSGVALVLAAVCVVGTRLPATAQSAPSVLERLNGYWDCVDARGVKGVRAYAAFVDGSRAPNDTRDNVYGREDQTVRDVPVTSWEHIAGDGSRYTIESMDGNASTESPTPNGMRFVGLDPDGKPLTIAYAFTNDDRFERTVDVSGTTSGERCVRQPAPAQPSATCDQPDQPGRTVKEAPAPTTDDDWIGAPATADVDIRVVLDDRSQVLWAEVVRSGWTKFNSAAVDSARATVFQTSIHACRPRAAQFLFEVTFDNTPS